MVIGIIVAKGVTLPSTQHQSVHRRALHVQWSIYDAQRWQKRAESAVVCCILNTTLRRSIVEPIILVTRAFEVIQACGEEEIVINVPQKLEFMGIAVNVFQNVYAVIKNLAVRIVVVVVEGIREVTVAMNVLNGQIFSGVPSNRHGCAPLIETLAVVAAR